MRTITQQTIAAALVLAMAFTFNACSPNDDGDDNSTGGDSPSGEITNGGGAQAYTDMAGTIKYTGSGELRFEPPYTGERLSIPVGKIEDGIVKLQFPDTTIDDRYLESSIGEATGFNVPECKDQFPADVKAISGGYLGYGNQGLLASGYWDMVKVKGIQEEVHHLYSTGAANIKCNGEERGIYYITGTDTTYYTITYDVNIVKGWNEIYVNIQRETNSRGVINSVIKYSTNKNILPNISKIKWFLREN